MSLIRAKSHEKLTKDNIQKVIDLLDGDTPITKKEACGILNIRYNTTRLKKIIEDHLDLSQYRDNRKAQLKGKGATRDEIKNVIECYLDGDNVSDVAERMYRSPAFVRAILDRVGVPRKLPAENKSEWRTELLPEQCVREKFEFGEKIWSPRNNKFAIVKEEITPQYQVERAGYACNGDINNATNYVEKYGARCYRLWVLEPCDTSKTFFPWLDGTRTGWHAVALAYDMGSLKHLEEYGVNNI